MSLLEILIVVVAGAAVLRAARLLVLLRSIPPLTPVATPVPSVTIACAGRDEAPVIERAVRSWLAQDVPDLQVVFVNDRSTDGTAAILARLAAEDPRLLVVNLTERPEGWLGKSHALQVAASRATNEFILFTDADVRMQPACVRAALAVAVAEDADAVVVMPDVECEGALQRSMTQAFFQFFLVALGGWRANADDGRCAIGIGAFNLIRRSAYEAAGGHEPIRLQVGDDVALVRLLQHAGGRHRLLSGAGLLVLKWQHGVAGMIAGLEKNFFWGCRLSVPLLVGFTLVTLVGLAPLLAPLAGSPVAWAGLAVWAAAGALPHLAAHGQPGRLASAVLHPAATVLILVTAWNSALRTLHRGGIRWRGDFFPLETLRQALRPWRWWVGRLPVRPRHAPP